MLSIAMMQLCFMSESGKSASIVERSAVMCSSSSGCSGYHCMDDRRVKLTLALTRFATCLANLDHDSPDVIVVRP